MCKGSRELAPIDKTKEQARVAVLTSDETDFKSKLVRRDKAVHFIVIKGESISKTL